MRNPLHIILTGIALFCIDSHAVQRVPEVVTKAERFSYDTLAGLVRNEDIPVDWLCADRYFHYSIEDSLGREHFLVDTRTWKKKRIFDCRNMSLKISELLKSQRGGVHDCKDPLEIYSLDFNPDNVAELGFSYDGYRFRYDSDTDSLSLAEQPEKEYYKVNSGWYRNYSADSLYWLSARGYDLFLFRDGGRDSVRLTSDGERYHSYALGGDSEKSPEALSSPAGLWVGASHKYFLIREDKRKVGTLTLVNSLAGPRPEAETYKFAMPGDKYVPQYEAWLVDAGKGSMTRLDVDRYPDQKIVVPRFSRFFHSDRYVWFIRTSRTCDTVDLCRVDVTDGSVRTLISEECRPHYNEQLFSYHILNGGEDILWWSERTGKGRYYLYDGEGNLRNAVTDEDFVSGNIVHIDTLAREIIFEGYGREKGVNPHYRFYYKASMDGGRKVVCLTPGNGHHTMELSQDRRFLVDNMSRMDLAPQHRICDMKGRVRFEMEPCDLSALYARGWKEPLVMKLHAADSVTDLYGVVYLPFDLDTTRRYPIVSSVYPGPQVDLVPQEFLLDDNYNQSLAQLGFVVVNFAYRGSGPYRGRDFYDFGYGNLRDYPLADDYAVIRQIGELMPFADTTRVGIYGHSGGGFMTATAMMTRPDFYKVGVAASGNYDNNIYSQWWGESFHGVSAEVSGDGSTEFRCEIPTAAELASGLRGKLLLITGDMDDNVHPANTMRLADALIRQGKIFDMMIIPGADHGLGDKYYVNLIRLYFAEHLLGADCEDINNR